MSLTKYMQRYAEPGALQQADQYLQNRADPSAEYAHVLVVPAFDEPVAALEHLLATCQQHAALPIIVVNYPEQANPAQIARTKDLYQALSRSNACVVQAYGLPRRQGVGLARKLGNDVALHLIAAGEIQTSWLRQTDADAVLPADYFLYPLPEHEQEHVSGHAGAVVFAHHHTSPDPKLKLAADLYDQHMAYYVAGLRYAGSPFAFPTLGSTICVRVKAYAQVRGFPKRNAGEDFYLLNKVAKVAAVETVAAVRIGLAARLSQRVPFGTGPALARIVDDLAVAADGSTFKSYHPEVFTVLRALRTSMHRYATDPTRHMSVPHEALLTALGWQQLAPRLSTHYPTPEQRRRVVDEWFDGLRTLRVVHMLQGEYPDVALQETLATPPIWLADADIAP
ncbi:MAG: hypothetical protein AAF529_22220 [Pseudomonadota bacterium]